jgi:ankyrin repeat protein
MLQSDRYADDERFTASWFNSVEEAVTKDVCPTPGTKPQPARVQYITMHRKDPCKSAWCNSYQQRSREFLADYRVVHELVPTARCAVAAVKYKDPAVALWFSSCANTTSKGYTPLMVASARGSIRAVGLQLIDASADPNIRSEDFKETALHMAAKNGHAGVIQILVKHGAELEITNRYGRRPMHVAIGLGCSKGVTSLLEAGAQVESPMRLKLPAAMRLKRITGKTQIRSLLYAVYEGHVGIAKLLLDARADVNRKGGIDLHPPIMVPVMNGCNNARTPQRVKACVPWSLWPLEKPKNTATRATKDMLELLLDYRADIRYQVPKQGDTVLHRACRRCLKDDVLQLLVDRSSDLRARNTNNLTPLQTFEKYCKSAKRRPLVKQILQEDYWKNVRKYA